MKTRNVLEDMGYGADNIVDNVKAKLGRSLRASERILARLSDTAPK